MLQGKLAVIILTQNEMIHLPRCIASLEGLDAEVFVIDSGSTDGTLEWAEANCVTVLRHGWINYAIQFNWALMTIETESEWVMRLDADEVLTPALAKELKQKLLLLGSEVHGITLKRRTYFLGRWMRFGGIYPTRLLRIWRRGYAKCEDRWMDEHMVLESGLTAECEHDFIDDNTKGLSFWIEKHNRYADREIKDILAAAEAPSFQQLSGQASRRRYLKERLYWRMPRFVRCFAYWCYRYFVLGGFLDGVEGFVFHLLHALWYRVIVDAKLVELGLRRNHSERGA